MLKINDEQTEKINVYFDYLDKSVENNFMTEKESLSIKSEVFYILLNEIYLTKDNIKTPAEKFLYESGIYKEIRKVSLKTARNQRAYLNRKKKDLNSPVSENDSSDFDEWAFYENSFNN